jgi:hypothetical protein
MDIPVMVAVIVERLRFEGDSPVVVDSTATWAAEASMAVAVVAASMAVAAVASTVVADTGKTAGLIQRKAAAGFQSRSRFCFCFDQKLIVTPDGSLPAWWLHRSE